MLYNFTHHTNCSSLNYYQKLFSLFWRCSTIIISWNEETPQHLYISSYPLEQALNTCSIIERIAQTVCTHTHHTHTLYHTMQTNDSHQKYADIVHQMYYSLCRVHTVMWSWPCHHIDHAHLTAYYTTKTKKHTHNTQTKHTVMHTCVVLIKSKAIVCMRMQACVCAHAVDVFSIRLQKSLKAYKRGDNLISTSKLKID